MRTRKLPILKLLLLPVAAAAQFLPARHTLTAGERLELSRGRDRLQRSLARLREQSERTVTPRADQVPDAEIYLEALDRNLRQDLFFSPAQVQQARSCLAEGERRVQALLRGDAPWERETGFVNLGYRSAVDGSAQPYQVYVPPRLDRSAPARLDLFLHGRGGNLNELTFLGTTSWATSAFGAQELPHLTLYPYGRANNGWRFAGERDLFEALADCRRRFRVDADQVTLRGFSMGGHGTWHTGLQHPGEWAVMAPGAGFTDTRNYQNITETFPDWQTRLLRLYDPVEYVANAANLPVLAYCGELDPALPQHQLIVSRLKEEGAPFREFIGPKTPHTYEPAARAEILRQMAPAVRQPQAPEVRFVTYTLRWPECKWVRLEGLERHWERSEVRAVAGEGETRVTTRNITALTLRPPRQPRVVRLDDQALPGGSGALHFRRDERGRWRRVSRLPGGLRKRPGLTGPIDDALFGPVLVVRGTGTAWSGQQDRWLKQELQRFREGWDEYYRAGLPETTDTAPATELKGKNLYLFGDPGSNRVLARLLPKLPVKWSRDHFELAGQRFSNRDHLPVLVFPNPEDPEHYVVLNTGFTFSRADWQGSNARQYPHLPDYAVLRIDPDRFTDERPKDTVLAGFFNERWQ